MLRSLEKYLLVALDGAHGYDNEDSAIEDPTAGRVLAWMTYNRLAY